MILKGKQRAHGRQLGLYLLKIDQNEHVEIHELRGFISDDLPSALSEIDAISKGTRAEQALFSLALNPPPGERVSSDVFEAAVEQVEQKLGLAGQPRAIVFHEKEGRRHAHAVWSRIDAEKMKAINLPFFKMKLKDISRELFFEHGWEVPAGLIDRRNKSPLNYSLEEWQQTRRTGLNPKAVKQAFQQSWAISDSRKAFAQALLDQGFVLARGDRRGFVAIDYQGEAYAIAKYTGIRTKAVKEPAFVKEACAAFPGKVIVGLDAQDGFVATDGWAEVSTVKAVDLARQFKDDGVSSIVYTDIARDGMMQGVNIEATVALAEAISIPVIASGGVTNIDDVKQLLKVEQSGIAGAITGRAIYEGTLDLKEAQTLSDAAE